MIVTDRPIIVQLYLLVSCIINSVSLSLELWTKMGVRVPPSPSSNPALTRLSTARSSSSKCPLLSSMPCLTGEEHEELKRTI